MPHLIVEHSTNLNDFIEPEALLDRIHIAIDQSGPFARDEVKGRVYRCDKFLVGSGQADSFIHVTIRIMPGRDAPTQKTLSQNVLQVIKEQVVDQLTSLTCSVTVEVRELNPDSYQKLEKLH